MNKYIDRVVKGISKLQKEFKLPHPIIKKSLLWRIDMISSLIRYGALPTDYIRFKFHDFLQAFGTPWGDFIKENW